MKLKQEKEFESLDKFILEGLLGYRKKNAKAWKDLPESLEELTESWEEADTFEVPTKISPNRVMGISSGLVDFMKGYGDMDKVESMKSDGEYVKIRNEEGEEAMYDGEFLAQILSALKERDALEKLFIKENMPLVVKLEDEYLSLAPIIEADFG